MSLPNFHKQQLAQRLQQDLQFAAPEYAVSMIDSLTLSLAISGVVQSIIQFKSKSYSGFNVVAELSTAAGEGQPETELWLDMLNSLSIAAVAKLSKLCGGIGCSSMKILTSAAPAVADLIDANVIEELPNSPSMGATGQ